MIYREKHLVILKLAITSWTCALACRGHARLYWSATEDSGNAYIVSADAVGSNMTNIVSGAANVKGPNGLEFGNGRLWWTDQQLNAVMYVNPNGSGFGSLTTAQNPYDVFVADQQVYWTSQTRTYVDTQLANGTGYQRISNSTSVTSPFAVEVTSSNLYWSQVNGLGSIKRSDLAGGNAVTLINNAYVYDFQVTSNHIYFADNNYPSAIKRANLDGTGVTNLVADGGFYNGVCVTADYVYWSALNDANGGGIRRCNLDGSNPTNIYNAPAGTQIRGIVVLPDTSATAQPKFNGIAVTPAGIVFSLQTEAGKTYFIQSADSLTNWTELTSFAGTGSSVTITNSISGSVSNLFFRAWTQ